MTGRVHVSSWVAGALATLATAAVLAQAPGARTQVPHVVFVTGDDEYRSEISMPMMAAILEKAHGICTSVAYAKPTPQSRDNIVGLEALDTADLMVLFVRWRQLPDEQLQRILKFTESGKPMIGLRTTTHAFQYPEGHPQQRLNDGFGRDVFGQQWFVHHGHRSTTDVVLGAGHEADPILRGVTPFPARSWLYHVAPLNGTNTVLLEGRSIGSDKTNRQEHYPLTQPVAWTRAYKGARVFFTTLGHPADFEQASMRRLLLNAIFWGLGREIPEGGLDATVQGTYVAPPTTG